MRGRPGASEDSEFDFTHGKRSCPIAIVSGLAHPPHNDAQSRKADRQDFNLQSAPDMTAAMLASTVDGNQLDGAEGWKSI